MTFTTAIPFAEAVEMLRKKNLLPNDLSSAELSRIGKEIMQISTTSAHVSDASILSILQDHLDDTIGLMNKKDFGPADLPTFVSKMRAGLDAIGYDAGENAGTIKDLSSYGRLKLMAETNHDIITGFGHAVMSNTPAARDAFPAQELYRVGYRNKVRSDWKERFIAAGGKLSKSGRMIARVDDDVWQNLGDGAGGYTDTLGNSWAPFAFGSGMGTRLIGRKEAVEEGVIEDDDEVAPRKLSLLENFTVGLESIAPELRAGIKI